MNDSFYFVHQPLSGNGSISVRVTSLTGRYSAHGGMAPGPSPLAGMKHGVQPWSKAGIIIKASTKEGSAYAAMMVTGRHGVRMQWNFTQDTAGIPGKVSAASPRWLRLTRAGDVIKGYDSADGTSLDARGHGDAGRTSGHRTGGPVRRHARVLGDLDVSGRVVGGWRPRPRHRGHRQDQPAWLLGCRQVDRHGDPAAHRRRTSRIGAGLHAVRQPIRRVRIGRHLPAPRTPMADAVSSKPSPASSPG